MQSTGIILIGSGPSLNRVDPKRFASFHAIAFNRSYLAWPDWGFSPTYHACLDPRSVAVIGGELPAVVVAYPATRFFFHRDARQMGHVANDHVTFCDLDQTQRFAASLDRLADLGNVGAISLQVLALLGYRKVLMVGVDGNYAPENDVREDRNHFRDDYAAGRTPLSDTDRVRYTAGWPVAAAECTRLGIEVRNASEGTALTCFEKIDLARGLAWIAASGDDTAPHTSRMH